uniref:Uncharacterized protein n=1 Tax=Lactuca sativa TaxID=4236 RepID=A0A9R1USK6_LACSA|nr:hypothetical protein LSAT_V11C800395230 [Lactuca sativa]
MGRFEACFVVIGWVVYLFSVLLYCFFKIDNDSTSKLIRCCSQKIQLRAFIVCFLPCPYLRGLPKNNVSRGAINRNNQTLTIAFGMVVENNLYCCT